MAEIGEPMRIRKVFHGISKRSMAEFETSAGIDHAVTKGTYREDSLRVLLNDKRML